MSRIAAGPGVGVGGFVFENDFVYVLLQDTLGLFFLCFKINSKCLFVKLREG